MTALGVKLCVQNAGQSNAFSRLTIVVSIGVEIAAELSDKQIALNLTGEAQKGGRILHLKDGVGEIFPAS